MIESSLSEQIGDDMTIKEKLLKEAMKSTCTYKVSAIAFTKKGNILGTSYCSHRFNRRGGGIHAEQALMRKYGSRIDTIVIMRVNKNGNILPIDPCEVCAKIADKMNIRIKSI